MSIKIASIFLVVWALLAVTIHYAKAQQAAPTSPQTVDQQLSECRAAFARLEDQLDQQRQSTGGLLSEGAQLNTQLRAERLKVATLTRERDEARAELSKLKPESKPAAKPPAGK